VSSHIGRMIYIIPGLWELYNRDQSWREPTEACTKVSILVKEGGVNAVHILDENMSQTGVGGSVYGTL
jgi:hypothetical protein